MKSKMFAVVSLCFVAGACLGASYDTQVITNQTPEIAVPASWGYESSPGTFFWNGFRVGACICVGCWMFSIARVMVFNDKEEL